MMRGIYRFGGSLGSGLGGIGRLAGIASMANIWGLINGFPKSKPRFLPLVCLLTAVFILPACSSGGATPSSVGAGDVSIIVSPPGDVRPPVTVSPPSDVSVKPPVTVSPPSDVSVKPPVTVSPPGNVSVKPPVTVSPPGNVKPPATSSPPANLSLPAVLSLVAIPSTSNITIYWQNPARLSDNMSIGKFNLTMEEYNGNGSLQDDLSILLPMPTEAHQLNHSNSYQTMSLRQNARYRFKIRIHFLPGDLKGPSAISKFVSLLADADRDDIYDLIDNCPTVANTNQTDTNMDGIGDACDKDNDGITTGKPIAIGAVGPDNCPIIFNPGQQDLDMDGTGMFAMRMLTGTASAISWIIVL